MSSRVYSLHSLQHPITVTATALLLLAMSIVPAAAKEAPAHQSLEINRGDNQPPPSFARDGMRVNAETGAPLAIYGTNIVLDEAEPELIARQYLRDQRQLLQLRNADLADLTHRMTRQSALGVTVRFDQLFADTPVHGAEIAVSIDPDRRVIFVANSYRPAVELDNTELTITAGEARRTAIAHLQPVGGFNFDETTLVVYRTDGSWRLVYRAQLVPRETPTGDWEVLVDATTGVCSTQAPEGASSGTAYIESPGADVRREQAADEGHPALLQREGGNEAGVRHNARNDGKMARGPDGCVHQSPHRRTPRPGVRQVQARPREVDRNPEPTPGRFDRRFGT